MKPLLTPQQMLLLGAFFLLLLLFAPLLTRLLCWGFGLQKTNFKGVKIPAATGLTFLSLGVVCYGAMAAVAPRIALNTETAALAEYAPVFLYITAGFGFLGLMDDKWGNREVGGFGGHLRALASGHPTTGLLKLVGGGIIALTASWFLHRFHWLPLLLDAAIIALAANTLNLLDTRPGRSLFGFFLFAIVILVGVLLPGWEWAQAHPSPAILIGPLVVAAALEWWPDARGKAMMGDTGSNLLGAAAGLAATLALPFWGRLGLLAVLLGLNLLAERTSLNALIERTPWLRAFDRALGLRS